MKQLLHYFVGGDMLDSFVDVFVRVTAAMFCMFIAGVCLLFLYGLVTTL